MTKLKCKPCYLFYRDDGSVDRCRKCGGELRRIKVHYIDPKSIVVNPSTPMRRVNDKHKN